MNRKIEMYVAPFAPLSPYGFKTDLENNESIYWYKGLRAITVYFNTSRLSISKYNTEIVRVLCQMYDAGILSFVEAEKKDYITVRLTREEYNLIKEARKND